MSHSEIALKVESVSKVVQPVPGVGALVPVASAKSAKQKSFDPVVVKAGVTIEAVVVGAFCEAETSKGVVAACPDTSAHFTPKKPTLELSVAVIVSEPVDPAMAQAINDRLVPFWSRFARSVQELARVSFTPDVKALRLVELYM